MKYSRRNKVGSNQFKTKKRKNISHYLLAFLAVMDILAFSYLSSVPTTLLNPSVGAASSSEVATSSAQVVPITSTPGQKDEITLESEKIEKEVKLVFGDAYPQAKQVLDCENHARNPKAKNDNTKWGGRGVDWGIFQINDSWQGVTNKAFLTDYTINIRMAYNIYKSWGNNFQAWTCGKHLGL